MYSVELLDEEEMLPPLPFEQYPIPPELAMRLPEHHTFMRKALNMAEKALMTGETPVGCVLVLDGQVVGEGMNDTNRSLNGTAHAETLAIYQFLAARPRSELSRTALYVTVEPCIMCASLLRQYNIGCVYYGCANDKFGGNGGVLRVHEDTRVKFNPPYKSYGGLFRKEAIMLLRRFYVQENERAPNPRQKRDRVLKTEFDDIPGVISNPQSPILEESRELGG